MAALGAACGGDSAEGASLDGAGAGGAGAGASEGFDPMGGNGQGGFEGCLTADIEGEQKKLDMLIVMDRSGSMAPVWSTLTGSIVQFFAAPSSRGIAAGINFFPPAGAADGCDVADYDPPQYHPGDLPTYGGILAEILDVMILGGETPTYAGLAGSLQWAVSHQLANPDREVVVVLASDGDPSTCNTDIPNIADLAADALASAGVRTFAIAIQGATVANLDQIAAAGGTGQALDVTADASAVEEKMNEIRRVTVACELLIPEPDPADPFDPGRVNVRLDPDGNGAQSPSVVPQVPNADSCGGQPGWYYDDPDSPTTVSLCPTACEQLGEPHASVRFVFGCPTILR
ncbi:MAG: VWA domain-containing protein [Deltaproteobacteria bacterium]|nr:VWA domain-containing protein [Deltaproteobacteria bacterium]MBW2537706.1 VWA domain-containing protein [Deltaproteobacteria bacterium]